MGWKKVLIPEFNLIFVTFLLDHFGFEQFFKFLYPVAFNVRFVALVSCVLKNFRND